MATASLYAAAVSSTRCWISLGIASVTGLLTDWKSIVAASSAAAPEGSSDGAAKLARQPTRVTTQAMRSGAGTCARIDGDSLHVRPFDGPVPVVRWVPSLHGAPLAALGHVRLTSLPQVQLIWQKRCGTLVEAG